MSSSRVRENRREVRIHDSSYELSTDLADYIAELYESSIKERGTFAIAISGGSLISLMRELLRPAYTTTIDWSKWCIFWTDERVVPKNHVDSNYKLANDLLLSMLPIIPSHVHTVKGTLSAQEAASKYGYVIRQLVRTRVIKASRSNDCPKFDLILLDMGVDGHVASLFPNHPVLEVKSEWVTFIVDSPEHPPERITFTLSVINSAANVVVVATGEEKAQAVRMAIDDVGPEHPLLPARMVQPSKGKLVWFLDNEAASMLKRNS
ncbi:hypothetical protein LXL04_011393 [Taraxacum kok-saghyz]